MPVTATIAAAAATVGSAVIASDASKKATKAQTAALATANDTQQAQYNQTRADQAPWRDVGTQALGQLSKLYGIQTHDINGAVTGGAATPGKADMSGFTASPDYQFALDEGNRNLNSGYAAKGALDSGAAQKAIVKYGQDQASSQYGGYFNKLATLAGYGTSANAAIQGAGQTATNNISNNTIAAGNAQASGYNTQANVTNSALGNLSGILSQSYSPQPNYATRAQPNDGGYMPSPSLGGSPALPALV